MSPTLSAIIHKDQVLPPAEDYALLRAEGLRLLQQHSGRVWTDYNDHDPGVTLLEALCFVLTDVGHRAGLPIAALLAPAPGTDAPADLLVPAHVAFANHPVTPDDYKKLLLDQVPELKNAWVNSAQDELAAPGHYQVALELYQDPTQLTSLSQAAQDKLCASVLQLLNQHRNLGDVFVQANVLRPHPVVVQGSLDLLPHQDATLVLARLLQALSQVLDPYLVTATVPQLLAAGHGVADIFAGPRVDHRLLVESSFFPQLDKVELGALLRQAGQVPGIQLLSSLTLYDGHPAHHSDSPPLPGGPALGSPVPYVAFAADEIGQLDVARSLPGLHVYQHGVPLTLDQGRVLREYRRLVRASNRPAPPPRLGQPSQAAGPYAEVGRYDSVQHLLPALYGIGDEGPPPATSATSRAYVMQLKGYLLLFDQLLADCCAQLAHLGNFLSPRPQAATYYSGSVYGVPHVAPLLPGTHITPDAEWGGTPAATARWQQYHQQPDNPYQQHLAALAHDVGAGPAGRRGFLVHLLARFGYTVRLQHSSLSSGNKLAEDEAAVQAYERLLTQLDTAAYHRAAARVPISPPGPPPNYGIDWAEAGLELFLFLLTGVESVARKLARGEHLAFVEKQVRLGGPEPGAAPDPELRLVVYGPAVDLPWLLAVPTGQPLPPTFLPSGRIQLGTAPATWELALMGEPDADRHPERLLAYLGRLDQQAERLCLLDHLVLKPEHAVVPESATANDKPVNPDFFYCQATLLLPGYATRFRRGASAGAAQLATSNRAFIEELVRQYAPAHLLINLVWLDYPQMRRWEPLYEALVRASGLLNPGPPPARQPGCPPVPPPPPEALRAAQQQAQQFLHELLGLG